MIDGDDYDTWREVAIRHAELAAHQIARFRNPWWNPTWRDLVVPCAPAIDFRWGSRVKRSRPDIAVAVRCGKGGEDTVACSPETPLDFGSGFRSEEGSSSTEKIAMLVAVAAETTTKRRRVSDGANVSGAKMVGIEKAPLVSVTAAKDNIRRTGRKKTLCELQEEEKKLIEEKNMIQKEMEFRRRAYGVLKAENQRLKDQQQSMHSERVSFKSTATDSASCAPSSSTRFILPDLNEPPPDLY